MKYQNNLESKKLEEEKSLSQGYIESSEAEIESSGTLCMRKAKGAYFA
ncbi:MAG: hypothetical protein Q8M92_04375 [Candidatus Subteraquimicrobiales bacterium]|nr:hypothetical protein [Candidatus Subteraquimicrobiales bacterium]